MQLWSDVKYALRVLVKKPSFSALAILALASGIGVNILVFSVIDAVLLRPLPYPDPERLVWISQGVSLTNAEYALAPDFAVWRQQTQSFSHAAAFSEQYRSLTGGNEPERILTAEVSSEFLSVLKTPPAPGRDFLNEEDQSGRNKVAIITDGFRLRRFGDRNCIGEIIRLDDEPFEIVGVLPPSFRFPAPSGVELLTPIALGEDQSTRERAMQNGIRQIKVVARLNPSVTLETAQSEIQSIQQGIVQAHPDFQEGREARLRRLHDYLSANVSRTSLVLMGAIAFLWLLGCLNVGNLLLARTLSRRTEMAVRISLGAGRLRVLKQILTENAVLTVIGCAAGLLIAYWGRSFLTLILPRKIFGIADIGVDARIALFTIISFALTTLLVSLLAAIALPSQNVADFLKTGAASVIGSMRLKRTLNTIVIGELALAVILLVGAGLLMRSFWALRYGDIGFSADQVLTIHLDLADSRYPDSDKQAAFFESLMERVIRLPGVETTAICSSAPPTPVAASFRVTIEGQPATDQMQMARPQAVSHDYFRAMRIPLVEGETFSESAGAEASRVVVVNRAFARKFLPDERAIGARIKLGGSRAPWREVIGVVEDFRNVGLGVEAEPEVYCPFRQFPLLASMDFIVRTSSDPLSLASAVRSEIWAMDGDQTVAETQTLNERLTASVSQPRFTMFLLGAFAALALLLAAVGIYSVMSYAGQQRTREIAIRLALGSQRSQVVLMMVKEGLLLSLAGAIIGTAGAMVSSRLLSNMLYEVAPSDPYTFIIVLALLFFTAMCGCFFPAYRAARVDPIRTLRYE